MNAEDNLGPTPDSVITSIKTAVADSLRGSDEGVKVHTTDYFNNTYAPDLVLSWPRDGIERFVYLRTSSDLRYLIEDVSIVGDQRAILMPLTTIPATEGTATQVQELQAASRGRRALVAEPSSFDALVRLQMEAPVVALASRSLMQGGSGLVGRERAEDFGETLARGFEGAKEASVDETASAVQMAEGVLDQAHANEVTSFLHAVWVGSGADGTTFPGGMGVTATPTGAALNILLRTIHLDDPAFWRRIARNVTFAKLAEVRASTEDENFQHLVRASVNTLRAKAVRIVDGPPSTAAGARWFMDNGRLGLRFDDLTAVFAGYQVGELKSPGIRSEVTVTDVKRRANRAGIRLSEITVATDVRRLDYAGEGGDDITGDAQLDELERAMGTGAEVRYATALIGARELRSNFSVSTAHGRTAAMFYLSELVEHAIPLFADFSRDEIRTLAISALGADQGVVPGGE